MGRVAAGVLLLLVSLFMLLGVLRADVAGSPLTIAAAVLLSVVLPAAGGIALIASHAAARRQLSGRRELLRQQTLESEVLRLAARHGGKLTVVEVVTELAISADQAKDCLDSLATRDIAEMEITDSGMLVYMFPDVQNLPDKARSKGILDD